MWCRRWSPLEVRAVGLGDPALKPAEMHWYIDSKHSVIEVVHGPQLLKTYQELASEALFRNFQWNFPKLVQEFWWSLWMVGSYLKGCLKVKYLDRLHHFWFAEDPGSGGDRWFWWALEQLRRIHQRWMEVPPRLWKAQMSSALRDLIWFDASICRQ